MAYLSPAALPPENKSIQTCWPLKIKEPFSRQTRAPAAPAVIPHVFLVVSAPRDRGTRKSAGARDTPARAGHARASRFRLPNSASGRRRAGLRFWAGPPRASPPTRRVSHALQAPHARPSLSRACLAQVLSGLGLRQVGKRSSGGKDASRTSLLALRPHGEASSVGAGGGQGAWSPYGETHSPVRARRP